MFKAWRLGKIFAIPLYVHPTFLIIPLLALLENPGGPLTAMVMVGLVLAVFGCVLLHELGHALMARYFGIGTRDITLYPIGGVARLTRMSEVPSQELAIAVAGPAVNVVIAAVLTPLVLPLVLTAGHGLLGLAPGTDPHPLGLLTMFAVQLWMANLMLVGFNLLPAFPMDGGRVLRALLSMGLGQLRATEIAAKVGVVLAVLIAVAGLYFGHVMPVFLAAFVIFAGQAELIGTRQRYRAQWPQPVLDAEPVVEQQPAFQPGYWPREPGFSGYTWDPNYGLWVKWQNGLPVGAFPGQSH
jgi:Zn-dependent protease